MVYFIPVAAAMDGENAGYALLELNLYLNLIPAVLTAIALFVVARNWGVRHAWLALLPLADLWVLGSLTDTYHLHVRKKEKKMRRILPLLGVAALVSPLIPALLGWLLRQVMGEQMSLPANVLLLAGSWLMLAAWGAFLGFRYIALCDLYRSGTSGKENWYMVLSIFFPFLIPFFIFSSR